MQISLATNADIPGLVNLYQETIRAINSRDYNPAQIAAWSGRANNYEKWERRIAEQYFIKAEVNQELAGFASLTAAGYLDMMFVDKNHQRRGIAQALLKALEARAITNGTSTLIADVSITARPFFAAQGFSVIRQQSVEIDKVNLINFSMLKTLTPTT